MKKWIRMIALLLLLIVCLGACKQQDASDTETIPPKDDGIVDNTTQDGTGDSNDKSNTEAELDPAKAVLLVENAKTEYALVFDDAIDSEARTMINRFRDSFFTKTSVDLKIKQDNETPQEKEILIYAMDGRTEVSDMMKNITAPEGRGYYIGMKDKKIIVACNDVVYLESALELLLDAVRDCGNGMYGVVQNYVGKLDIPKPIASVSSDVTSYYTGEGNYTVTVEEITAKNYEDYCDALNKEFDEYSTNQIGSNLFSTYVQDSRYGRMAVYTMYYPKEKCYKITYGPLGYLPALKATAEGDATVQPSITQNARDGSKLALGYSAAGMCSIVQLTDGRFILFDGGPYSASDASNQDDLVNLYNLLKSMTPNNGTPVIAGWFFSHAHGDHMQLAVNFLEKYHGQFELQMVGHNFPDFDSIIIANENKANMKAWVDAFYEKLDKYYPQTPTWVVHTGEVLNLPGCKLEVVYTPEDYGTTEGLGGQTNGTIQFPWGNHSCSVFRLTVNKTKFLVLGDAEATLCKWMADNYGTAMKSDVLSLSHHGLNGGELSFYKYIDPDICFWPIDEARMVTDTCRKYDFNQYLLNIGNYGGRTREHYCADATKTILC